MSHPGLCWACSWPPPSCCECSTHTGCGVCHGLHRPKAPRSGGDGRATCHHWLPGCPPHALLGYRGGWTGAASVAPSHHGGGRAGAAGTLNGRAALPRGERGGWPAFAGRVVCAGDGAWFLGTPVDTWHLEQQQDCGWSPRRAVDGEQAEGRTSSRRGWGSKGRAPGSTGDVPEWSRVDSVVEVAFLLGILV